MDDEEIFCEACLQEKQHRAPFSLSITPNSTELLQLVHSNVCGPMTNPSISRGRYFMVFVDDKSRYTWTYILKKKVEVFDTFQEFKALVENSSERRIKVL